MALITGCASLNPRPLLVNPTGTTLFSPSATSPHGGIPSAKITCNRPLHPTCGRTATTTPEARSAVKTTGA